MCYILGEKNPQCQYTMVNPISGERTVINTCNFEKDLGVTFDSNLIFDQHIQNSINKANKMIGIIKRTFMHMDKDIFSMLYKAFVRPHLEYGNIIWYPRLKRQSAALERVQRRATKLVKGIQNLSYEDRLRFLEIPTLKTRRLRGDLIQVYKIFNNIDDIPVNKFFTISHMNNTRNSTDKIYHRRCRTNLRKFCFSNRITGYWNKLTPNIKRAHNTNMFKSSIDKISFMKDQLW